MRSAAAIWSDPTGRTDDPRTNVSLSCTALPYVLHRPAAPRLSGERAPDGRRDCTLLRLMAWMARFSLARSRGAGGNKTTTPASASARRDRWEYALYSVYAGLLVLHAALLFYGQMKLQLGYAQTYASGDFSSVAASWSAPLDDVFIHFDFARATARGYPMQWSEGNGYSSGGTSLLYPFVLALGYWAGFRKLSLMLWAAIVACVCCLGFLLGARRLFSGLPRGAAWLAPPAFLCVGALDWTLFSGMEVALFLALWAAALVCWDDLLKGSFNDPAATNQIVPRVWPAAARLGLSCALMTATRPESALLVALFGISAALVLLRRQGRAAGLSVLLWVGTPGALILIGHAIANKVFTGDSTAAGALVKLEMHHPLLSSQQVWDAWLFHVRYQVMRVTHYHLSEQPGWGWILWGLGVVAVIPRGTRRYALLLWASCISWVLVVALNGQVRWQNERYTMPALAWLLMLAALGLGAILSTPVARGARGRKLYVAQLALGVSLAGLFVYNQLPRFREQVWFFARASRNIRDQHLTAGALLAQLKPNRVLVGDAGALTYQSDLPGLDIIGLGGYHDLPFARATQWGVPSALELIERMPPQARPQALAIYPSWWGTLPLWFGDPLIHVPVRGNVICGGADKVIYRANWTSFEGSGSPQAEADQARVVDSLDLADIVSEKQHDFVIRGALGYVTMKLLANPSKPDQDLWDGGRIVPQGSETEFVLRGAPGRAASLVLRTAQSASSELEAFIGTESIGKLTLPQSDVWREDRVKIPSQLVSGRMQVRLRQLSGEGIVYHLWLLQAE